MTDSNQKIRPRIAVLIPAYNADTSIGLSLASLQENKEPHDIVIVDDGSIVPLASIIPATPNLTILRSPQNEGIVGALNRGVAYILAQGYEYLARLDSDDISTPDRLTKQLAFLDTHPEIGAVGSWGKYISEEGNIVFHLNLPTDHDKIVREMYYNSQFIHPSMMFRTSLFKGYGDYHNGYPSAEDYELMRRLIRVTRVANLPDYMILYRVSKNGISLSKRKEQLLSRLRIQWKNQNWVAPDFYFGLMKTIILYLLPYRLITAIKRKFWRR